MPRTKIPEAKIREAARMRFRGDSFQKIADHLGVQWASVQYWERTYPEWNDEIQNMNNLMKNALKKKRKKFIQEWEDWQQKQRQMALGNLEIATRKMLFVKQALEKIAEYPDAVERVKETIRIDTDRLTNSATQLQKTASLLMREYFQTDEILDSINRGEFDNDNESIED